MQFATLQADVRTKTGSGDSYRLRESGKIPAVFYGKGKENLHLSVVTRALEKILNSEKGMNTLIELQVTGKSPYTVLVRDFAADPIRRNFTHVDFVYVDVNQKIHVNVPIILKGKPVGLKEGGILEHSIRKLDVECSPANIPSKIEVDVSGLKVGDNLHLHDLKLPEGAVAKAKQDLLIAAVFIPKEQDLTTAAPVVGEPEVLTEKKDAKEGEAAKEGEKAGEKKAAEKPAEKAAEKKAEKK